MTAGQAPRLHEGREIRREILHVVRRGDTLWAIAARYLDDPYRYPELARLSDIRNPDLIYPGDEVRILILGAAADG
ncbi:MAG: LysM peptidoglycan-binding domain-containing protein [Gammaproteobacteria bacterium]|nr:LysM peptidoglycan-binding domain-containing protein [Gammaproteobacteria bacterium]MDX5375119.1 LysM peptidoglycan-binding domain-containing protein [Gammaproteobacteria bacterium]